MEDTTACKKNVRRPYFKDRLTGIHREAEIEVLRSHLASLDVVKRNIETFMDSLCDAAENGVPETCDYWDAASLILDDINDNISVTEYNIKYIKETYCLE